MDNNINLLIIGIKCPPETFIQRKLNGLAQTCVNVTVASVTPYRRRKCWKLKAVRFIRLPHWHDNPIILILRFLYDFLKLIIFKPNIIRKVVKAAQSNSKDSLKLFFARLRVFVPLIRLKPDIIHFEWNSAAINFYPLFKIWKAPIVISCRGRQINVRPHIPGNDNFKVMLSITFSEATAVHCVSEAIMHEAMKYGMNPEKAWVIRPAVDPDFFYPANKRDQWGKDVFKLISVGSLIWRKGYEYALMAVRLLVDHGVPVQYEIIGGGPEHQRVLYTIHDLKLDEHVRLLGQLPPRKVRDHLQAADVFVLSSLSEGISNAVLEAMACGLPVVTTDCGGMREAVSNGVEGYVVPVRNPEAMKNALLRLWKNPDLRIEMGVRARKRILHEFTLERQISSFLKLYTTVIQEYHRIN